MWVFPICSLVFFLKGRLLLHQALCFLAGANSIFDGDTLLTTPNNKRNEDLRMFDLLGLTSRPAFLPYAAGAETTGAGAAVLEQKAALAGQ